MSQKTNQIERSEDVPRTEQIIGGPEAAENTTGINSLDRMIIDAPFGTATAIYASIEIGRSNPELGKRIQDFIRSSMPEFFDELMPQKSQDGEIYDGECDVMPAVQWLRFLDGFKAAKLSID